MHVLIPTLHRATKPVGVCCHAANLAQCLAVADRVWYVTLLIGRWQQTSSEQSFSNFSKSADSSRATAWVLGRAGYLS